MPLKYCSGVLLVEAEALVQAYQLPLVVQAVGQPGAGPFQQALGQGRVVEEDAFVVADGFVHRLAAVAGLDGGFFVAQGFAGVMWPWHSSG